MYCSTAGTVHGGGYCSSTGTVAYLGFSPLLGLGAVGQEPMAQVFKKFQKNPYNYFCFLSNTFRSITFYPS